MKRSISIIILLTLLCIMVMSVSVCFAAVDTQEEGKSSSSVADSIKYLSAALSVGLCALATGIAQSRIGAAGMGSIVEKPETTGTVIIMLAIPETMVILGFVVAAIILIL